jgi:hypothetical protein
MTLAGWALLGWLPIVGLARMILGVGSEPGASPGAAARPSAEWVRCLADPPLPQLATNSLLLGLEAAAGILGCAWLVRRDARFRSPRARGSPLIRPFALMPPLLQGIGILSLPWLIDLAATAVRGVPHWEWLAPRLGEAAVALGPDRNPWPLLVFAVGLAIGLKLWPIWEAADQPDPHETRSRYEAALLAGVSRARAHGAGMRWRHSRWLGRFLLAAGFAATNLTPALLLTPWMDGRTVAPGILVLADGPDAARLQAAALALGAIAVNLAALIAARFTSAVPRDG